MAFNSISVHTNQISRLGLNQKVLKEGSSVLVRIIADRGNGKYTASIAEARVNLSSNKNLKIGSSFIANIFAHDGKIFISPKDNLGIELNNVKLELLESNQLINILQNLGLPADSVSLSLFQMAKQLEMKLDQGFLGKLHKLALKFSGKEKSAAEILLLLAKKGIDIDEEEILQLIGFLEAGDKDFLSDNEKSDKAKDLLNRMNQKEEAWIIFPFEIVESNSSKVYGHGNIKLLPSHNKKPKLLNLECKYNDRYHIFNLNYDDGKLKKIKMYISDIEFEDIEDSILSLRKKLIGFVPGLEIEWSDKDEIEGFASQGQNFYSFEGNI